MIIDTMVALPRAPKSSDQEEIDAAVKKTCAPARTRDL
jgi:hypothetical protein